MSAREVGPYCCSLVVIGALAGTAGPSFAQSISDGPIQKDFSTPVFRQVVPSLPRFLDQERLPDLHNAWRVRTGDGEQAQSADEDMTGEDTAMSAARAAMQRRKQAIRHAPDVRHRAEALSRLFGATEPDTAPKEPRVASQSVAPPIGKAAAAAQDAPTTITTASAPARDTTATTANAHRRSVATGDATVPTVIVPASEAPAVATLATGEDRPPLDPPYGIGGPPLAPDADAAPLTPGEFARGPTAPTDVTEAGANQTGVMQTGALGTAIITTVPPLPVRAPEAGQRVTPVVTTSASRAAASARAASSRRKSKPDPALFPNQLRAFGWNTQPE